MGVLNKGPTVWLDGARSPSIMGARYLVFNCRIILNIKDQMFSTIPNNLLPFYLPGFYKHNFVKDCFKDYKPYTVS